MTLSPDQESRGKRYKETFDQLLTHIGSLDVTKERAEHFLECSNDWSIFKSLSEVEQWFRERRDCCQMKVEEVPLNELKGWLIDPVTGNIYHDSGHFFRVHGIRVQSSDTREVGRQGWDQPVLTQIGYDGGLLGIIKKRFEVIPHYLLEAKAEPGNYKLVQISPTLQATFSNLARAHKGRKPLFASFFETPEAHNARVLYKAWLSEDGGRLFNKRNLGMLVEVDEGCELPELTDDFQWFSMFQIKSLLQRDAWVNPHVRGIIAHL